MASAWKVARICASRSAQSLRVRKQEVPLRVPGGCLTLVVPESEEDVLDLYIESGSLSGDPYWACPWPSAAALAERLALIGKAEFSKREGQVEVADLGAGLGLAGLAAAREGAARVTLLDREPIALRCAMLAAELNGLETSEGDELLYPSRDAVGIHLLDDRGEGIRPPPSMSSGCHVSARIFDWTAPVPSELHSSFDVVMACDVLYDKDAAGFVASAVPSLLKEDGLLLLADPPLRTPKHREAFVEYLNKNTRKGNGAFVLEQVCSHHVVFEAREFQVQIMHFRRSNRSTIGIKLA